MSGTLGPLLSIMYELAIGKGDDKAAPDQRFLDAFSRAFLSWQFIEANLWTIYGHLAQSIQTDAASAAYHSVLNLNIRLRMIDSAAKAVLKNGPLLDRWAKLSEKVSDRARNRNNLAHFTVRVRKLKNGEARFYLCPSIFNPLAEKQEFDAQQILQFRDDFTNLANEMHDYSLELLKHVWHSSPEKSS